MLYFHIKLQRIARIRYFASNCSYKNILPIPSTARKRIQRIQIDIVINVCSAYTREMTVYRHAAAGFVIITCRCIHSCLWHRSIKIIKRYGTLNTRNSQYIYKKKR